MAAPDVYYYNNDAITDGVQTYAVCRFAADTHSVTGRSTQWRHSDIAANPSESLLLFIEHPGRLTRDDGPVIRTEADDAPQTPMDRVWAALAGRTGRRTLVGYLQIVIIPGSFSPTSAAASEHLAAAARRAVAGIRPPARALLIPTVTAIGGDPRETVYAVGVITSPTLTQRLRSLV